MGVVSEGRKVEIVIVGCERRGRRVSIRMRWPVGSVVGM